MKYRHAFTMLELIFVIVIMGIIGKFGVEFIANAYRSFIYTKINHTLQSNSAMAVELIASRLQHRIKDSIIARNSAGFTALRSASGGGFDVLEWIGNDIDGFRGLKSVPSWSGINDIEAGTSSLVVSPSTNTGDVDTIIKALSNNNSKINDAALYFVGSTNDITSDYGWDANATNKTYINAQKGAMHPIKSVLNQGTQFATKSGTFKKVLEYYKLSWTAYAVGFKNFDKNTKMGDLYLYYDYQPWNGEKYTDTGTKSSLLMENVDTFQFMAMGSIVKIQVCVKSAIIDGSADGGYSICKEKTIY